MPTFARIVIALFAGACLPLACIGGALASADESPIVAHELLYHSAPFPQCHASTIAQAADGSMVAAFFGGTREKHPDVGIWVSRQVNGQWTAPVEVANGVQSDAVRHPCWNPVLLQSDNGPLLLFFKVGPDPRTWWGEMLVSHDNGRTWQDRRRLGDKLIGPVKNKPLQLADGSIWCPSSTEHDGWRIHLEVSRDGGQTFTTTGPLNAKEKGAIQPSLLTYADGRMQMLCRNQDGSGDVWQTWSSDAGQTWSELMPTGLPNPNSGTDAVTLADGRQLLVYNHTHRGGEFPSGRQMLNVAVSKNGEHWFAALLLERSQGEYSYPAVIQTSDGLVHITYTWQRRTVRHVVLDPALLQLTPIVEGRWPDGITRLPEAALQAARANRQSPTVAAAAVSPDQATARRPNVLFIAADDLRPDLGCYGHPRAITPNLDALAARGVRFDAAYCQQALCNPSRASLMTGRRPDTLGIWNLTTHFRRHADIVPLPEWFKRHGYFTQDIGKIYHNWRQELDGDPASWSVPARMHHGTHGSDEPQVDGELPPNLAAAPRCERRDVPDEAYFDGRIAAAAVSALLERKHSGGQPFFLAVGFWKPHLPFNAPKKYWDLYDAHQFAPAANASPPRGCPEIALHNGRELIGQNKAPTDEQAAELRHGYLAGISYLDAQVGRVVNALDQLGLAENTVIVFWSDHGFHLGEHGLWCKTSNFELDARVPLVIVPPGGRREGGAASSSLVELLDLYPTLVELCGLPQPTGLEGKSLAPVLDDPSHTVKPAAYTQHPRPAYYQGQPEAMGVSVRTPRYRYTEWRGYDNGEVLARELYDHQTDPGENENVVDAVGNSEAMKQAEQLLLGVFPR